MFGNCSELTALIFIGLADKYLKSWLQKPRWKFLNLPCLKWDLHLIQIHLKVRLTNVSKSDGSIIAWISVNVCSNVINGLMTKSREHSNFVFVSTDTSEAVKLKCFYVWAMSITRATLLWTVTLNSVTEAPSQFFFRRGDGWTQTTA